MPYSAASIANAFLNLAWQEKAVITQLKLQKLVYYAAGYYSAAYNESLLDCSIEAWQHGPVVPSLYREFRNFGHEPITRFATVLDDDWDVIDAPIPSNDDRVMRVVNFVWRTYGGYSALELSEMTHAEGTPWFLVRRERPGVKDADIDEKQLRGYFSQYVKKKTA